MKKTVNVDEIIDSSALEITVGGKTFSIRDVSVNTLIKITKARETEDPWGELKDILVEILGKEAVDLEFGAKQLKILIDSIIEFTTEAQEPNPSSGG